MKLQDETLYARSGKIINFRNPDSEKVPISIRNYDYGNSVNEVGNSFPVLSFLKKSFADALCDGDDYRLFKIAVRAVLFKSSFVEIDPALKLLKYYNFDAQENYYYTLPSILICSNIEYVKIVFQNLGKYCKVYGSLNNGTGVYSVFIGKNELPFPVDAKIGQLVDEKQVFEFMKKMEDGLVLPLLIDLCEKTGTELPPCFIKLPTDLKLKILESVSGVDIANVSCVCSELRHIASSDALWKQKYIDQFGNTVSRNGGTFKGSFARAWENEKIMMMVSSLFNE